MYDLIVIITGFIIGIVFYQLTKNNEEENWIW